MSPSKEKVVAEPVVAQPGTPRNILHQQAMSGLARTQSTGPSAMESVATETRGGEVSKVIIEYY